MQIWKHAAGVTGLTDLADISEDVRKLGKRHGVGDGDLCANKKELMCIYYLCRNDN